MSITTAPTSAKTAEPTTADTNAAENTTASKQYLKLAGLILGLSCSCCCRLSHHC